MAAVTPRQATDIGMCPQFAQQVELELTCIPKLLRELTFHAHLTCETKREEAETFECRKRSVPPLEHPLTYRRHKVGITGTVDLESRQHAANVGDASTQRLGGRRQVVETPS